MSTPDYSKMGFPRQVAAPASVTLLAQNSLSLAAGEYLAQRDLVQLSVLDGSAYRVRNTDSAVLGTSAVNVTPTSSAAGAPYARHAVLQATDGYVLAVAEVSGGSGLAVYRYAVGASTPAGTATLSASGTYYNAQIARLSNGNYVVAAFYSSNVYFAILDKYLNVITALTANSEAVADYQFGLCALAGGGFVVVYTQNANSLLNRLFGYDNTGALVTAATTIWTRTGTYGVQRPRVAQLSNGNLVVVVRSNNTSASIGTYWGIVTTAGAGVVAFSNFENTANSSANGFPELSVMEGYFAIAMPNGAQQFASVYNNAGTLQGSGFAASTSVNASNNTRLLNDGSAFYLLWQRSSDTMLCISRLPVSGTGYATSAISASFYNNTNSVGLDAFIENGNVLIAGVAAGTIVAVQLATFRIIVPQFTPSSINAGSTLYARVISVGDGCFAIMVTSGTPSFILSFARYMTTAIIGVVSKDTPASQMAAVQQNAGAYAINTLGGSVSKAFDFSATTALYGNKGTLMPNSVVLKGM